MLRIALVIGPRQTDLTRPHETGEVIHVAIGFVIEYPAPEPEHGFDAQEISQMSLCLRTRQLWVAIGIQQALFGYECGALSIDVNRSAFVDQRRCVTIEPFDLEHLACDLLILIPRMIEAAVEPAPCVEAPVDTA